MCQQAPNTVGFQPLLATVCYWNRAVRDSAGTAMQIGHLFHVATEPAARSQGHATRLLGDAIDALRAAGCQWAILSARQAAIDLYTRAGWQPAPQIYWRGMYAAKGWNEAPRSVVERYAPLIFVQVSDAATIEVKTDPMVVRVGQAKPPPNDSDTTVPMANNNCHLGNLGHQALHRRADARCHGAPRFRLGIGLPVDGIASQRALDRLRGAKREARRHSIVEFAEFWHRIQSDTQYSTDWRCGHPRTQEITRKYRSASVRDELVNAFSGTECLLGSEFRHRFRVSSAVPSFVSGRSVHPPVIPRTWCSLSPCRTNSMRCIGTLRGFRSAKAVSELSSRTAGWLLSCGHA
jgi:hypothetical protein